MCKVLGISRSVYYYKEKVKSSCGKLENAVLKEFYNSRSVYGTRKLRLELQKDKDGRHAICVSRRKIGLIMEKYGLVSKYTLKHLPKVSIDKVNRDNIPNLVKRDFANRTPLEVVVSDLTYIRCGDRWCYICVLLDLHSRRIIGSAVGKQKDAKLVRCAFFGVQADLRRMQIFHTDRGSEFKNKVIDEILTAFNIKRSLSAPGTPIDNACAESMYNIVKTEFAFGESFASFGELELKWFDYVNWYNNVRIHGSLGYLTPCEYERQHLSPPEFIAE